MTGQSGDDRGDQAASTVPKGTRHEKARNTTIRTKTMMTITDIRNALSAEYGDRLRTNRMTGSAEFRGEDGTWRTMTAADESAIRECLQNVYSICQRVNFDDALCLELESHPYEPVHEMMNSIRWDGKKRMSGFLTRWLKVEDTEYTREVSRLLFLGGAARAYNPGCKFDYMIVLGGAQGSGKSSIVQWLNMDEKYYREVKNIHGAEGCEALQGGWICEFSELMAMSRSRDSESVKAYLTRQVDTYRKPYARYTTSDPRRVLFIGTTNSMSFLSDNTGNRRFLPVWVNSNGHDLWTQKDVVMHDIRMCWAEAVFTLANGGPEAYLTMKQELLEEADRQRSRYEEDDWRSGVIDEYIRLCKKPGELVCGLEIWKNSLGADSRQSLGRTESKTIAECLRRSDRVRYVGGKRLPGLGYQKCYEVLP